MGNQSKPVVVKGNNDCKTFFDVCLYHLVLTEMISGECQVVSKLNGYTESTVSCSDSHFFFCEIFISNGEENQGKVISSFFSLIYNVYLILNWSSCNKKLFKPPQANTVYKWSQYKLLVALLPQVDVAMILN